MHFAGSEVQTASSGTPAVLTLKDADSAPEDDPTPYDAFRASVELGDMHVYSAVLIPADSTYMLNYCSGSADTT